ncbi:MAG: hypothetical protein ACI9OJ_000609 [Myxococcota bacterium]|jgi:hypothetical protein
MANTKNWKEDTSMRKGIKRAQRKALGTLHASLTPAERKKLKKEPMGIKKFIALTRKAAEEG